MIVYTKKHSYLINNEGLDLVEVGSSIYDPEEKKMYLVLAPGELTEIPFEIAIVKTLDELAEAIVAGGNINIAENIDAPSAFEIIKDTTKTINLLCTFFIFHL